MTPPCDPFCYHTYKEPCSLDTFSISRFCSSLTQLRLICSRSWSYGAQSGEINRRLRTHHRAAFWWFCLFSCAEKVKHTHTHAQSLKHDKTSCPLVKVAPETGGVTLPDRSARFGRRMIMWLLGWELFLFFFLLESGYLATFIRGCAIYFNYSLPYF